MIETISDSLPFIFAVLFSFLFWGMIRLLINSLFYDKKKIRALEDEVERLNLALETYKDQEMHEC